MHETQNVNESTENNQTQGDQLQETQNVIELTENNQTQDEELQPEATESSNVNKEEMIRSFTALKHGTSLNQKQIFSAICYNCGVLLYGRL